MANDTLNPGLRQIAEQYLNRPLEPQEALQLLTLQHSLQPAPPIDAVQQARQQVQQNISQGREHATSNVRGILEVIQQSSSQALQVQEKEEQAILKLLEGSKTLAELRSSSLQSGHSELHPGSQLALARIADHLSNLIRQEVEQSFQQTFCLLNEQLQTLAQRMNELEAKPASIDAPPER